LPQLNRLPPHIGMEAVGTAVGMEEAGTAVGMAAQDGGAPTSLAGSWLAHVLAAPYYGYSYGSRCYAYQPMYGAYGNYVGQQPVNIC
jgi:hypothetical protein